MIYFCNAEHLTDIIYFHILYHTTRIFLFHIHAHEGSFYFLSIPPKVKYQDMMFVGLTVSIFLNIEIEIAPLEVLFVICVCLCIVVSNSYCVVFCLSSSCVPYVDSFSGLPLRYSLFMLFVFVCV